MKDESSFCKEEIADNISEIVGTTHLLSEEAAELYELTLQHYAEEILSSAINKMRSERKSSGTQTPKAVLNILTDNTLRENTDKDSTTGVVHEMECTPTAQGKECLTISREDVVHCIRTFQSSAAKTR